MVFLETRACCVGLVFLVLCFELLTYTQMMVSMLGTCYRLIQKHVLRGIIDTQQ